MDYIKILKLLASIIACQAAGIVGSIFTAPAIPSWYSILNKPFFTPPSWVFAPAWLTIYTLMGISLYLAWVKGLTRRAIYAFSGQLFLNAIWSIVFFGMQSPFLGLVVIGALWVLIFATIIEFGKISRNSAYLLVPYIAWVSFAALLNAAIWILN